jgi:citrate lyase gamma subunit
LHPAGVSDSKVSELNVYPNPVNGNSVTVKLNSDVDANSMVVIRDVIGKQVAVYNVNNIGGEMNLNVSNLNNGMFFVNVESNNAIISSSKLLINK